MSRVKDVADVEIAPLPAVANYCSNLPLGCLCVNACAGWTSVGPNEEVAILHCGVVTGHYKEPGCFKVPCAGMSQRRVTTARQTIDLPNSKIVDSTGSPILVSAIINFCVRDAMRAMFSVENYRNYVLVNAGAVLKRIVSKHSYNELKSNTEVFNQELSVAAQRELACCGIEIFSMCLNELNYAPEIASSMLKTQAAGALVEARHLIVTGAVSICEEAIKQLEAGGLVKMEQADKVSIVKNLLVVCCSDSDAQPTVTVG